MNVKILSDAVALVSPCDGVTCKSAKHKCTDTTGVCDACTNEWAFGTVPDDECKTCGKTCKKHKEKYNDECSSCDCNLGFFTSECNDIGIYGAVVSSTKDGKTIDEYNTLLIDELTAAMDLPPLPYTISHSPLALLSPQIRIVETKPYGNGYRTVYSLAAYHYPNIDEVSDFPDLTELYDYQAAGKANITSSAVISTGTITIEPKIHDPHCSVEGNTATPKCQVYPGIFDDPKTSPITEGSSDNTGAIVGGVVGGLAGAGALGGAAWYVLLRKGVQVNDVPRDRSNTALPPPHDVEMYRV